MSRPPSPLPDPITRTDEQLLRAIDRIYRELDQDLEQSGSSCAACGDCCHLVDYGHELWLTEYELAYLFETCGVRAPSTPGVCPYLEQGRCAARAGRALSCRIFHCELDRRVQERLHETYLGRLRGLAADRGGELGYGELLASLSAARGCQTGNMPRAKE